MPKKSSETLRKVLNFIIWVVGVLVFLSVGFAMIGGSLILPFWLGGNLAATIVGWTIITATLIGVVTAIFS